MCQLLGMNCNIPTDICFSFTGFRARGGATDVHRDGWGIAFFEGRGVRVFLDPQPSAESPVAELVRSYPIRSLNVIAHIRKATQGSVALENTHPFMRELWGHYWIFACDDCTALASDYVTAIEEAKTCNFDQLNECTSSIASSLPCGCPVFVNPGNEAALEAAAAAQSEFNSKQCGANALCAPCAAPLAGACSPEGQCYEVFDQGAPP